jgi:hypothetical protein
MVVRPLRPQGFRLLPPAFSWRSCFPLHRFQGCLTVGQIPHRFFPCLLCQLQIPIHFAHDAFQKQYVPPALGFSVRRPFLLRLCQHASAWRYMVVLPRQGKRENCVSPFPPKATRKQFGVPPWMVLYQHSLIPLPLRSSSLPSGLTSRKLYSAAVPTHVVAGSAFNNDQTH